MGHSTQHVHRFIGHVRTYYQLAPLALVGNRPTSSESVLLFPLSIHPSVQHYIDKNGQPSRLIGDAAHSSTPGLRNQSWTEAGEQDDDDNAKGADRANLAMEKACASFQTCTLQCVLLNKMTKVYRVASLQTLPRECKRKKKPAAGGGPT